MSKPLLKEAYAHFATRTLEPLASFYSDNFSFFSDARNVQVIFAEKPQMKINSFQKQKHENLIQKYI